MARRREGQTKGGRWQKKEMGLNEKGNEGGERKRRQGISMCRMGCRGHLYTLTTFQLITSTYNFTAFFVVCTSSYYISLLLCCGAILC